MKRSINLNALMIGLLMVMAMAGCGGGGGGGTERSGNPPGLSTPLPAQYQWNFLVYLDGDNNLEAAAIRDFNEMELIGSTANVNVLVLLDRIPGYDASNGDWTGTRLYRVEKDSNTGVINSQWITGFSGESELDMSDPVTLQKFISYCQLNYPAEHTALTLWNHGGGVYPRSIGRTVTRGELVAQGIGWDDTTGTNAWNCLTTDEVELALGRARMLTGKKVDIINLDSCLTMMLEVAYQWRNEADYLVGSEANVPEDGNRYQTLLEFLTQNSTVSPRTLAGRLVEDYHQYYGSAGMNTTYAALDLGLPFSGLMNAFQTFAAALENTGDWSAVLRSWFDGVCFEWEENVDLGYFAEKLRTYSSDEAVREAATALQAALAAAMIDHRETGSYRGNASGLAILLPTHAKWQETTPGNPYPYGSPDQYPVLALARDTRWNEFIQQFADLTVNPVGSSDTIEASVSWTNNDINLIVAEPLKYIVYAPWQGLATPNGFFNRNCQNGGTETYSLRLSHTVGYYLFYVESVNYTGNVTFSFTSNGVSTTTTMAVVAGATYPLQSGWVKAR
jgi:hypothetical protein